MNPCRSQILRGGFLNGQCNLTRRAVVLDYPGTIHRNVRGTLIEIGYGIATGLHH